jgi:hypothetical protein
VNCHGRTGEIGGGIDAVEINAPPGARTSVATRKTLRNIGLNYRDWAYWADAVRARRRLRSRRQRGVRLAASDKVTLKLIAQNLFDEDVQQHIFGDIIGRKIAGQVSIEF